MGAYDWVAFIEELETEEDLQNPDREHEQIFVAHPSGWSISIHRSGRVELREAREGEPWLSKQEFFLRDVPTPRLAKLLALLAAGRPADVIAGAEWVSKDRLEAHREDFYKPRIQR